MNIEPIAIFHSPFTSKFGLPRQSGIVSELRGEIHFLPAYRNADALQGLEDFDYLWLIWGFSEHVDAEKHPTVRPPLLGGNERVGVWASRSPFRPNNLGLSSVRINSIDLEHLTIEVLGADLMDGTPIYDIKPYLPYADSHPEARGGFTDKRKWKRLQVSISDEVCHVLPEKDVKVLIEALSLDPRPHYQSDANRQYGMPFMGFDVRFHVADGCLYVDSLIEK